MKKLIITALCAIATSAVIAAPPQAGEECNAGGENGRLQNYRDSWSDKSNGSRGGNFDAQAKGKYGKTVYVEGKANYGNSGSKSSSDAYNASSSGLQCVTESGKRHYNWDDGHK